MSLSLSLITDTIMETPLQKKRVRTNSDDTSLSTTSAVTQPSKRARLAEETLPNGIYHITNSSNGSHAALLDGNDRSEVVNITFRLNPNNDRGSEWLITHLDGDKYKVQSVQFASFASCDNRPSVEAPILGKQKAFAWIIRQSTVNFGLYNISPPEEPDIFWISVSEDDGTPSLVILADREDVSGRLNPSVGEHLIAQSAIKVSHHLSSLRDPFQLNSIFKQLPNINGARYETDPRPKCLNGTRIALLKQIRDWSTNSVGSPIFWLCGQAGTGKTTISLTVAEECDRRKQLGASVLFSRDQADRSVLRHVFPTIVHQLSRVHPQYATIVGEILAKDSGVADFLPSIQLERLIVRPLEQCPDFPSPTVIVIDALDECMDNKSTSTLLDLLQCHLPELRQLKFFITSRPEPHIESAFSGALQQHTTFLTLNDIDSEEVDEDIRLLIETTLSDCAKTRPDLDLGWPSKQLVDRLVLQSAQHFIYAATATRAICDPDWDDPEGRLQEIIFMAPSTFDSALDQLYLGILQAAHPKQADLATIERLRDILGAIIVADVPFTVAELATMLGLEPRRVRAYLRRLHSVLIVPTHDYIRIIHPSFFDFLTKRCTDERFRVDEQAHNTRLAISCFEVMDKGLMRNIFRLDDPSIVIDEIPGLPDRMSQSIPRALSYACRHWSSHFCQSGRDEVLLKHLEKFLSNQLLHWIEVLGFSVDVSDGVNQLHEMQSFLETTFPNEARAVAGLLRATVRFMAVYDEVLCDSPLHIYTSAFGLLPPTNLLKQTYEGQVQSSLRLVNRNEYRSRVTVLSKSMTIRCAAFSPDGIYFSAVCDDNFVHLWHAPTATRRTRFETPQQFVWTQFDSETHTSVFGSTDHNVAFLLCPDPEAREISFTVVQLNLTPDPDVIYAADADFNLLGTLSGYTTVRFWETKRWGQHQNTISLPSPGTAPRRGAFELKAASSHLPWLTYIGAVLICTDTVSTIHVLLIGPNGIECKPLELPGHDPTCFSISPDSLSIAVGTKHGVLLVSIETGLVQRWYMPTQREAVAVIFAADGRLLSAIGEAIVSLPLVDGDTRESVIYRRKLGPKCILACSHIGQLAFTTSDGICLVDDDFIYADNFLGAPFSHLTASGSHVIQLTRRCTLSILDTGTGVTRTATEPVICAMSSPDSRHIVAGTQNGSVLIYEIGTNLEPRILYKHPHNVVSVGFSQEGTMVLSVDRLKNVVIWDLGSQRRPDHEPSPGLELPSPLWNIHDPTRLCRQLVFGEEIEFTTVPESSSFTMLRCRISAPVFRTMGFCSAIFDSVSTDDGLIPFTTTRHLHHTKPNEHLIDGEYHPPLHYHVDKSWVVACSGSHSRCFVWLPRQCRDVRHIEVRGDCMLISRIHGPDIVLDVKDHLKILNDHWDWERDRIAYYLSRYVRFTANPSLEDFLRSHKYLYEQLTHPPTR